MKNQNGITLISLVITIILVVILASVAIYTGIESYDNMRAEAFIAKMKTIQEAVDKLCEEYTVKEMIESDLGSRPIGLKASSAPSDAKAVLKSVIDEGATNELKSWFKAAGDEIEENYRYFSINDISTILGIKDFDTAIFLNPRTRNVIAVNGIQHDGKMYYRQYDLDGGQTLQEPNTDTDFSLNVDVKTFDNKAVIYINTDKIITELKYQKKNGTGYDDPILSKDLSKITITESGTYKVIATTNSLYSNGEVVKTSEDKTITIVNKPLLVNGMTPIKYNGSTIEETTAEDEDWYNYSPSEKRWANVELDDGSIYVWIPRYAYSVDSSNSKINVEFMKGSSSLITTSGRALSSSYKIIPAFEDGSTIGFSNGEWDSTLNGIWIAKYEAILTDSYGKSYSTNNSATVSETISDMATYCANVKTKISEMDLSNVDTHLMKNSEWGAVAYLTWSDYGNFSIMTKSTFKTQLLANINTLSTGNYYGVDGLVGSVQEAVAAGIDVTALNVNNVSTKYVTLYGSSSVKSGDGINENEISWEISGRKKDYPDISNPFFTRGGYDNGSSSDSPSLFTYLKIPNDSNSVTGFRPVLIIEY